MIVPNSAFEPGKPPPLPATMRARWQERVHFGFAQNRIADDGWFGDEDAALFDVEPYDPVYAFVSELSSHSELDAASEADLIARIARGDRAAFERIYYLYTPRLGRFLNRFLRTPYAVEEVINDVMLVVWQSAGRYDAKTSRLSTWLFGIAHNKMLKALARAGRHAAEVSYDALESSDYSAESFAADAFVQPAPNNPERELLSRQTGEQLTWALAQLSPEHRSVIELAFGEHCSYEEIANIAQCPVNTVKTRVFHARKKLSQLLASRGIDVNQT